MYNKSDFYIKKQDGWAKSKTYDKSKLWHDIGYCRIFRAFFYVNVYVKISKKTPNHFNEKWILKKMIAE